ncbi:MAG: GNAT family N-acetyltransferase [Porticoccaceae bacterium]|jgi:GNAT superfamily N-acetyltransferase|nr:GNAT family N-acetyltransferase [Porticoccaceae bacterium]MBT5578230.1 GNAT family N-acetyltransferase [Porticoccaceae bacterium]MBT7375768.1 GNAT family N-acetyltransferase [Porticoccaceae bacterium]
MTIETGTPMDLSAINRIITQAVMAWPMPERIKRLSVPVICYDSEDFKHYQFLLYLEEQMPIAVAAWNPDTVLHTAAGKGRLLHGLYVLPDCQGRGLGRLLMERVFEQAAEAHVEGVLIKAERASVGFFEHCGLERLAARSETDYPYQFWRSLK